MQEDPFMTNGEMQLFIHTVQPGDSLFSISRRYNLTMDQLRCVNGVPTAGHIVPGQALLIALYIYTVQPEDSLLLSIENLLSR